MSHPVGFQKLAFAPRLVGAAAGAGLGFAAAPQDEGSTGAVMGAMTGYGLGALGSHLHQRFAGPPGATPAPAAGATPAAPAAPMGGLTPARNDPLHPPHTPAEMATAHAEMARSLDPHAQFVHDLAKWKQQQPAKTAPAPVHLPPLVKPTIAKVGFEKLSDASLTAGVPGLSVGLASKDERLPGMNRWVPRETLEHAYQGLDDGLDAQALQELAAEQGSVTHPAIGAGIGAALAHFGLSKSLGSAALGALAGGGAGALYNKHTAGQRQSDMREAVKGVEHERNHHGQHTAREAVPMVVGSIGDA